VWVAWIQSGQAHEKKSEVLQLVARVHGSKDTAVLSKLEWVLQLFLLRKVLLTIDGGATRRFSPLFHSFLAATYSDAASHHNETLHRVANWFHLSEDMEYFRDLCAPPANAMGNGSVSHGKLTWSHFVILSAKIDAIRLV
jgi:hypothetical protein